MVFVGVRERREEGKVVNSVLRFFCIFFSIILQLRAKRMMEMRAEHEKTMKLKALGHGKTLQICTNLIYYLSSTIYYTIAFALSHAS